MKSLPRLLIEVSAGLVAEQGPRGLDQGTGHRDPLLLAAGHRARAVLGAVSQSQVLEQGARPLARFGQGPAGDEHRHHHVLEGRELGQQVMELEDEPQGAVPELPQGVLVEREHVLPGHHHAPALRAVQAAEDMEERRLPHSRCAHDRDHLARGDGEVHPGQNRHIAGGGAVALDHVEGGDEGVYGSTWDGT